MYPPNFMDVRVLDFYDESLGYSTMAEVSLSNPEEGDLLVNSIESVPAPLITFVLDSSGSMENNIENAKLAALALVDVLPDSASLRVLLFDTRCLEILPPTLVDRQSRKGIKAIIQEKLWCLGGGTNIELPIVEMLAQTTCVCFVSDGLANVGFNTTSDSLLEIARRCTGYQTSVINTLGIQFTPDVALNAFLLKGLAEDTGGMFNIAKDTESLKTFVGQILGTYYFQRGAFKMSMRAANGAESVCETPVGGYKLRADKPTRVLFKWTSPPVGKRTCVTHFMRIGMEEETEVSHPSVLTAEPEEQFRIVAALVSPYLNGSSADPSVVKAVERLSKTNDKMIPLLVALTRPSAIDSAEYVGLSTQVYDYHSMGGGDLTPALINLGNQTQQLSQTQNPY